MKVSHNAIARVLLLSSAMLAAGCVPAPDSTPAPSPAPVQTAPPPAPAPSPMPAPAPENWMDVARTPGDWTYRDLGFGTQALYSDGKTEKFVIQCMVDDPASQTKRLGLMRPGDFDAQNQFIVRTESATRAIGAAPTNFERGNGLIAFVAARDPILDAMALTKGRFAVETSGMPTLYLPAWAEVTRVIEDCR